MSSLAQLIIVLSLIISQLPFAFRGQLVSGSALVSTTDASSGTEWSIELDEDWEAGISEDLWINIDRDGAVNGDYRWGTRPITNPQSGGRQSAWATGGGEDGSRLDPAVDGYPGNVDSWLIYGPMNMIRINDATLSFNYLFDASSGTRLQLLISRDGVAW